MEWKFNDEENDIDVKVRIVIYVVSKKDVFKNIGLIIQGNGEIDDYIILYQDRLTETDEYIMEFYAIKCFKNFKGIFQLVAVRSIFIYWVGCWKIKNL